MTQYINNYKKSLIKLMNGLYQCHAIVVVVVIKQQHTTHLNHQQKCSFQTRLAPCKWKKKVWVQFQQKKRNKTRW